MTNSKACSKCGQIKSIDDFSRHNGSKASKSGRRSTCKACDVEANRLYRSKNKDAVNAARRKWAAENKDKKAVADKKYREANKEQIADRTKIWRSQNQEELSAKSAAYRAKNKDKKALTDKLWALNNKDKVNANSRRWRQNNPEKAREVAKQSRARNLETQRNKTARRRALAQSNGSFLVTKLEILAMLRAGCFYCGALAEHIDHIIPISRGGRHSIGNLTGACASCNLSKGSKFITEWKKGKWTSKN
jgi:5-methylcytosine-specific restriction endonuclease McrA